MRTRCTTSMATTTTAGRSASSCSKSRVSASPTTCTEAASAGSLLCAMVPTRQWPAPAAYNMAVVPGASETMRQESAGTVSVAPVSSRTLRVAGAAAATAATSSAHPAATRRARFTAANEAPAVSFAAQPSQPVPAARAMRGLSDRSRQRAQARMRGRPGIERQQRAQAPPRGHAASRR